MFFWYLAPWIGLSIGFLTGACYASYMHMAKIERYHSLLHNRKALERYE